MRCYNGCPDKELQAHLDALADADKRLSIAIPGASCKYFPNGEFYQVFINYKSFGGEFKSKIEACDEAIKKFNNIIPNT